MANKEIISRPLPFQPATPQEETGFYNMPTSPMSHLVMEVLGAEDAIADLPERKQQVNHNAKYEVLEQGGKRIVSYSTGTAEISVELADISRLNMPAKKLFVLSLIKANEQAIHAGQLTREYVSFPLQELVGTGFYNAPQSARKGFKAGIDALTSLKVKGKVKKSKKKTAEVEALEVLFTGGRIERGQCLIFLNPRINWSFIAQYFTILPPYFFRLPNRASDLLYYVCYLARQHTKEIKERGYFTIGFRTLQHFLQLPNEKGLNNPQRDIKDAIRLAVEQIRDAHGEDFGTEDFILTLVYDETAPIGDYLDTGYLKVELKGTYAARFIEISQNTEKQIEEYQKRQAKIQDKAQAEMIAKKLLGEKTGERKPRSGKRAGE